MGATLSEPAQYVVTDEYIAGFFDGEGGVNLRPMEICFGQKDRTVLEYIRDRYPAGKFYALGTRTGTFWDLKYHGRNAADLVRAILPRTIEKRAALNEYVFHLERRGW